MWLVPPLFALRQVPQRFRRLMDRSALSHQSERSSMSGRKQGEVGVEVGRRRVMVRKEDADLGNRGKGSLPPTGTKT